MPSRRNPSAAFTGARARFAASIEIGASIDGINRPISDDEEHDDGQGLEVD
jgi:hypothetical protein